MKKISSLVFTVSNPVRQLKNLVFHPPEKPKLSIKLRVQERIFHGEVMSKQEAKNSSPAAKKALEELFVTSKENRMDQEFSNPVGHLNNLFQPPNHPQYRIISGPGPTSEKPTFFIELRLQERIFYGEGKSKKEAKKASAQKAVENLNLSSNNEERMDQSNVINQKMSNPVGQLNNLFGHLAPNNPKYRIISGPPEKPNFSIELCVKERFFYGEGKSKKEAKRASAQKAVEELILTSNENRMEQEVIEVEKGILFGFSVKGAIHILRNSLEGGKGVTEILYSIMRGRGWSNQKLHNNYRPLKNDKVHEISQNLPNKGHSFFQHNWFKN